MRLVIPIPSQPRRLWLIGAVALILVQPIELAAQPEAPQPPAPPQPPWVTPQQPLPAQPNPYSPAAPFPGALLGLIVIVAAIWLIQKKLQQEEEEEVTPLSADPAAGFEYKIMRSALGSFRKPEALKAMLEEETRAGWELFEKLDDCRIRLRRPTACRQRDAELTQDPYRTRYSVDEGKQALRVVLVLVAFAAAIAIGIGLAMALSK
jgi:hypothetical protein